MSSLLALRGRTRESGSAIRWMPPEKASVIRLPSRGTSWRPACLLVAIAAFGVGLGPIWSVILFLATYNAGHIAIRVWGFRRGWKDGLGVGQALHERWLGIVPKALAPLILLLLGLDAVLLSRKVLDVVAWHGFFAGLALVAAFVCLMAFRWPRRTGRIAVALVLSIPLVWVLIAALNG